MVAIRYGNLRTEPGVAQVTGIGSQPGPGGGDGWQIVARLPSSDLPAGARRYAFIVTGHMGNLQLSGATPTNGIMQVCLGDTSGLKHASYRQQIPLVESLPDLESIPFQFMVLFSASPSIVDPLWGSTWNASAGFDLCIWARTYRNNDPANYAVTFSVTDISWLWWDITAIPAGDCLADEQRFSPPAQLTTTLAGVAGLVNTPGSTGQKWLHFCNVNYTPRQFGGAAPAFQFGFSTGGGFAGFTPRIGTNERWGMGRWPQNSGPESLSYHQGGIHYEVQPGSVWLPGLRGRDRQAGTTTLVGIFRYFGVRLDNLPDVLARTDVELPNVAAGILGEPFSTYVPLERPATGIIAATSVIAHGIPQSQGDAAYEAAVMTNLNRTMSFPSAFGQTRSSRSEGISGMAFGQHGLGASYPDLQYRTVWVGSPGAPAARFPVRDISIVQFGFVRDPSTIPALPDDPMPPLTVVPGKESLSPGSLNTPPYMWHRAVAEEAEKDEASIAGTTGYKRTWPLGVRVRRTFLVEFGPHNGTEIDELQEFFAANPTWRFTPTRGAAIAVLNIAEADTRTISGHTYALQVRVGELTWVGVT